MSGQKRERWSSTGIAIAAAFGSAVGLGNMLRCPWQVAKYGSSFIVAFFIIWLIMHWCLKQELGLGQKMQAGAVVAFDKIKPGLGGVGLGAILFGFMVVCYYNVILSWCANYIVHSWTISSWGADTESFFSKNVLHVSKNASIFGHIVIPLLFGLIIVTALLYLSAFQGVKSLEKAVKITLIIPALILVVMLIRGLWPDAGRQGVYFAFCRIEPAQFLNPEMWAAACAQHFWSLGIALGIMPAYGSYNERENITRYALTVAALNSGFSVFFAIPLVFSGIGIMAAQSGVSIEVVVAQIAKSGGIGLGFITFPEILSRLPWAPFFAFIFFLMLLNIGVNSAFSLTKSVAAVIRDKFPQAKERQIALYICISTFIGGVCFTASAGLYYIDIADHFITHHGLMIVGLAQSLAIGWIYGARKMGKYILSLSKIKNELLQKVWMFCWIGIIKIIIPVCLLLLWLNNLHLDLSRPYENYPQWTLCVFGWAPVMIVIFAGMFYMARKMLFDKK